MSNSQPVLEVHDLTKYFTIGRAGLFGREKLVRAVDGVSLKLEHKEILALVGESGCGKSTLALTLMGLEKATSGKIIFDGVEYSSRKGDFKSWARNIQVVFQDPYESLNPLMSISDIITEPLEVHGLYKNRKEREEQVLMALEAAGLKPAEQYMNRLPHELSGGQRQRVVIAGAIILKPRVLLADEPVSMLDVSIRAEILNLLSGLSQEQGISILYITHDLSTAAYFANQVAVMYLGRIVEIGACREVLESPAHPYTKALISVIPVPNPRERKDRIILHGDPPNATQIPAGCRFHPRCPVAVDQCKRIDPQLVNVTLTHQAACLLLQDSML